MSNTPTSQRQRVFEKDQEILDLIQTGRLVVDIKLGLVTTPAGTGICISSCPHGYIRADLAGSLRGESMKPMRIRVHRAVALAASGLQLNQALEIGHIDNNKTNNCHTNLQWVTRSQNILAAVAAGTWHRGSKGQKLDASQWAQAMRLYQKQGWSFGQIARHFGVSHQTAKKAATTPYGCKGGCTRPYTCIGPDGQVYKGKGLAEFCRLMGLSYSTMVASRRHRRSKTKAGWACLP